MPLWWLVALSLTDVASAATVTSRADSLTVAVATRSGTRLGSVRIARANTLVLTTWRALPLWDTAPSASTVGLTSAEWTAEDLGDASTVEIRLAIDTLTSGNRILVRAGRITKPIMLAMPVTAPPDSRVPTVPSRPTLVASGATAHHATPDTLPEWVRHARDAFQSAKPARPPSAQTSAGTPQAAIRKRAEPVRTELPPESVSRGLTQGSPSEPDDQRAPVRPGRYDLGELIRPAGLAAVRAAAPEKEKDEASVSAPAVRSALRTPAPPPLLRFAYVDAPRFGVIAVERPLTAGWSLSLESARALGAQSDRTVQPNAVSVGARWYLLAQRRTPYLFADAGLAWSDSTSAGRSGAGLGVVWPVGAWLDLDAAVRAWGRNGTHTEPLRATVGLRLHFVPEM
ncbi:MAG: hypothetical protein H3C62_01965 [Gemmatimonadaceae bacterium]|nr:hypothetical protein [Gemmatimonadaceae bacterium]